MPRNTDAEDSASEAPAPKRVRREPASPSAKGGAQEGGSQSPAAKSNRASESSAGAIVKVAQTQLARVSPPPPARSNLSLFRCFGRPGTAAAPANGKPGSALALIQRNAIAAALEASGDAPSLPQAAHEDRNPSVTHVSTEAAAGQKEISHRPSDPVAHKAAASKSGPSPRKAADPVAAVGERNAKKDRLGSIPRKPASSHGTPKKQSPAGTPRSPSRERIVVVPPSSHAASNPRASQQSLVLPSSKLAIACACPKPKSPVGQSGSQKSKVQAKMSRAGGESGPVEDEDPIGLRQPRRAGKGLMTRPGGGGRGGKGKGLMIGPRGERVGGGGGERDVEGPSAQRERKGKMAVMESDDVEPAMGDIILRNRPTRDNDDDQTSKPKMITFYYDRRETVFKKFDHLLRHRFAYNPASDKMVLVSTLYRYLPGRVSDGDGERLRWIHIDNAKKSLRMFSQQPYRPPFADSFRFEGLERNYTAAGVVIDS
ncbi:hypothetical protein MPTK1_7g04730 [Marchantia polymorpha subsp. ruderalis]|uniref:Uncharacterized protein n=2 Tax=Marchantia polymorpha TaxID=3197 RepID=A0AAF6BW66_MARPO|nr:hypothetical protein MARPO_0062s0053 [Marchantia polymorpha]BBN16250.1 hypothetical protein Mp_7g04730 [Marchantia polymorpha subsp. ruderalis]|eukprot:PTQ36632.1 hypothetical protein MARPO_0062s0053 [Marchantia polymorpha]